MKNFLVFLLITPLASCRPNNKSDDSSKKPAIQTAGPLSPITLQPLPSENPPEKSPTISPTSSSYVKKVLVNYQVGSLIGRSDESKSMEDSMRDFAAQSKFMTDHPDQIITFSRNASDYDDFCVKEEAAHRRFYVYEPETKMYYVCVANRQGKWVSVPAFEPQPDLRNDNPYFPSMFDVVGRTNYSGNLKPGERREIYLER